MGSYQGNGQTSQLDLPPEAHEGPRGIGGVSSVEGNRAPSVRLVENIPEVLRRRPQWVTWKLEERRGKETKVPYIAGGVGRASSTDLMTWRTFEEAVEDLMKGRCDGVGFVFCSADPFVGVDLDDCRDPETGEIAEWAQRIIDSFEDAVLLEASPSGCGVHLITRGTCKDGINTKAVEVYGQDRFFTVTGEPT